MISFHYCCWPFKKKFGLNSSAPLYVLPLALRTPHSRKQNQCESNIIFLQSNNVKHLTIRSHHNRRHHHFGRFKCANRAQLIQAATTTENWIVNDYSVAWDYSLYEQSVEYTAVPFNSLMSWMRFDEVVTAIVVPIDSISFVSHKNLLTHWNWMRERSFHLKRFNPDSVL